MTASPIARLAPILRRALLGATALAALAAVPTQAADGTLARDRPAVTIAAAERWRLRPAQTGLALPAAARPRLPPAMPIPEERRAVRQVYPALTAMR